MPMFSIVVPAYNAERTLRECLESIVAQTFTDFEVIIVNDGSTDKTVEIATNFSKKDPRIKLFSFLNSGVSETRRRGLSLSSGEYIIQVDSDDSINKDLLSRIKAAINSFDSPDLIRFQCELIDDNPNKDHQRYNCNSMLYRQMSGMEALKLWSKPGKKYALYWLYAVKKEVFSDVLLFPPLRCYEDVALIPLLIAKSRTVVTIGYVGYNYQYVSKSSLTNTGGIDSERKRAQDFVDACHLAVEHFMKLANITTSDLAFFVNDFNMRLEDKFQSLPPELQDEMYDLFH